MTTAHQELTRVVVYRQRVMTPDEATKMIGSYVDETDPSLTLPSPREGELVQIVDPDTDQIIGLITRLEPERTRLLRETVQRIEVGAQGSGRVKGGGGKRVPLTEAKTFGYTPKKPMGQREGCYQAILTRDQPAEYEVLRELSGYFGRQFRDIFPEQAEQDLQEVHKIKDDWMMDPEGMWTSGIVNKTAVLPYHRDGANLHTWSAMPVVRYGVTGGQLHLPEYAMSFSCRDSEVAWFCGKELVHGVTPMASRNPTAYRFSIVYYARSGMVNCRSFAEETANLNFRRTVRERQLAARLKGEMVESADVAY